jgi:hypothetical protein
VTDRLNVLITSAEMVPFAKNGGLADVAGALPKALAKLGHDVRVVLPRYGRIDPARFNMTEVVPAFPVPMDHNAELVSILETGIVPGVKVYFVNSENYLANRENIYGYPDDGERDTSLPQLDSGRRTLQRLAHRNHSKLASDGLPSRSALRECWIGIHHPQSAVPRIIRLANPRSRRH